MFIFIYYQCIIYIYITAQIKDMKECLEVMENEHYGVPRNVYNRDLNGNLLKLILFNSSIILAFARIMT